MKIDKTAFKTVTKLSYNDWQWLKFCVDKFFEHKENKVKKTLHLDSEDLSNKYILSDFDFVDLIKEEK